MDFWTRLWDLWKVIVVTAILNSIALLKIESFLVSDWLEHLLFDKESLFHVHVF